VLAYLVRARMLDKKDGSVVDDFNGAPADAPKGTVPWFEFHDAAWRTHTIVFGHWAALGLSIGAHHVGLDTGCVWGKQLTAYDLDTGAVTQVKAVEKSA
jgi:bis(5'-nucleosyl)-tetraphosphatase (symmetrical)